MTSQELRNKFLEYFEKRGHKILPSSSLVPAEIDPSVLFTTAGMHPLVPYLLGEKHPLGKRLCDVQKCLRTGDIEEVGDSQHCTFFEMLGYWSLGDYFKKESIHYTFDFYTQVLGFNENDIFITVFAGDENTPFDQESFDTWKNEIEIPEERIYKYGRKENWWGPVGETGPCGPCTEMFIDTGIESCGPSCGPSCSCDKFVEIGNNVFMEFNKTSVDRYEPLAQKNVDVGLGFERLLMISQNKNDVFETDLFAPAIKKIERFSGKKYQDNLKEFRIITDHLRAAIFAIADGAIPSNKGAGYVVRRLIRRALVYSYLLMGKIDNVSNDIYPIFRDIFEGIYDLSDEKILTTLNDEEIKYSGVLISGVELVGDKMDFDKFFDLYQSKGLHPELIVEIMQRKGFEVTDQFRNELMSEFDDRLKKHQELSRTASAGMFKGGLADSSEETTKLHTAAHLLLALLRKVLGEHVTQKGSNITAERLRFDFSHPEKMTPEQIAEVESLVNKAIEKKATVTMEEMSIAEAKKSGAHGVFDDRYGDKVKVFTITDTSSGEVISKEICGGPHVTNTSELGKFKIKKEESSSSGVRRIKAILE